MKRQIVIWSYLYRFHLQNNFKYSLFYIKFKYVIFSSQSQCINVNCRKFLTANVCLWQHPPKKQQIEYLKVIFCFFYEALAITKWGASGNIFWVNNGTSSVNIKTAHIAHIRLLHFSKRATTRGQPLAFITKEAPLWGVGICVRPSILFLSLE